jgi:hypothetical protein
MTPRVKHQPGCGQRLTARQMKIYTGPCPACTLMAEGYRERARAKSKQSKTKFMCPLCDQHAWAKPDAVLICGNCFEDEPGDPQTMLAVG